MLKTPPKGLYCPRCLGTWLKVLNVYRPVSGVRIRYRGCVECGFRCKTKEVMLTKWVDGPSQNGEQNSQGVDPGR